MSDTNGTVTEVEVATPAEGKTGRKKKNKSSRFMELWNCGREHGSKHKLKGTVQTDLGEVVVTLQSFPETLDTEGYESAAAASSLAVKYPLEGMRLAGIDADNGNCKFTGVAALEFLGSVQETE